MPVCLRCSTCHMSGACFLPTVQNMGWFVTVYCWLAGAEEITVEHARWKERIKILVTGTSSKYLTHGQTDGRVGARTDVRMIPTGTLQYHLLYGPQTDKAYIPPWLGEARGRGGRGGDSLSIQ